MYTPVLEIPTSTATRRGENARRALLLQTTLDLIAQRGIDGVTHRSVADAAGVALGSTTYWFSSRQQMLTEALEHFARLEMRTLREHLADVLGDGISPDQLVDRFTAILLPQLEDQRWRTVAQYTLLTEAARRPELVPVAREWTEAWAQALSGSSNPSASDDPEVEARMFLAMLDGLLLGQLATPDDDFEERLLRPALRRWFAAAGRAA